MNFPNIDRAQAQRQLELLGYQPEDHIYLRFFYPSDDPRKGEDRGRKADRLNWQEIENYQRQGRGVYFVINGGGHKNDDVTAARALFIEHDDLDKDLQREIWQVLDLPEPTFQVDTGGKSVHSYWVFDQPAEIEAWCELQKDLLEFAAADRSIKNPARVMRLAGAWHISMNSEFGRRNSENSGVGMGNGANGNGNSAIYQQSRLISDSGKKYSFEELRSLIPHSQPETSNFSPATNNGQRPLSEFLIPNSAFPNPPLSEFLIPNSEFIKHPDQIQIPVPEAVPLLACCRKEVRDWVAKGVPQGSGRNDTAIAVGLELIAVERHLQQIGQPFSDSARQLFAEYCQRSGMSAKEDEERWKWCWDKNPTPSCGDDGIAACLKGWYWRLIKNSKVKSKNDLNSSSPKSSPSSPSSPPSPSSPSSPPSPPSPSEEATLLERIDAILDRHLSEAQQDLELVQLAKQLDNYNASEIRALAGKRRRERDEEDNLSERKQELERLESWEQEEYLPFGDLFYAAPHAARAFAHLCRVNQKIQPQYFLGLLSPLSSLIGIKGSVQVPVLGRFRPTVNIACVGESGEGKSIVSGILLDPLYHLQKELRLQNQQQQQQFQQALEAWEKQHPDVRGPKPRPDQFVTTSDAFLVINEYSREGIVKNHADNPNGLLIHQEELVAIQRAQNMYRQGKGDDRQFLNNLYDNKCISRALKSERLVVDETAVAIFGGYQPAIILSEMGDLSDPDGQWARFNFITGLEKQVFTDLHQPRVDVSGLLYDLYRRAYTAPAVEGHFDQPGLELLQQFINEMEARRWQTLQPGMRAVLSKASGEVCRLALDLHWLNCLLNGGPVTPVIPAMAIEKAIKIKRYFLRQMELIRTWGEATPHREDSLAPFYRELQKIANRMRETSTVLTVRMVQQARSSLLKGLNADGIKKLFQDLAAMGKATLVKWKRSVALTISDLFGDGGKNSGSGPQAPLPPSPLPIPPSTNVGNVGDLLKGQQLPPASLDKTLTSFVENVESVGRCFFSPLTWPFPLPTVSTAPTLAQSHSLTGFNTFPTFFQQTEKAGGHNEAELAWLLAFLDDLEQQAPRLTSNEQLAELLVAAEEKAQACQSQLMAACPDYWQRVADAMACASQALSEREAALLAQEVGAAGGEEAGAAVEEDGETGGLGDGEKDGETGGLGDGEKDGEVFASFHHSLTPSPHHPVTPSPTPSLQELKGLLLACQTLTELKVLQKRQGQRVQDAYRALSPAQQLQIDRLAANAFPHPVYKYTGQAIQYQGQDLPTGALVYIDPNSPAPKASATVPVWLLRGLELGWQQAVSVSRHCLILVEKAVSAATEVVEPQTGNLLDGLT